MVREWWGWWKFGGVEWPWLEPWQDPGGLFGLEDLATGARCDGERRVSGAGT